MGGLMVGAGKVSITPLPDMFPFPMWLGTELTGVHSDLFCRTCAVDDGVKRMLIISFDLVGAPLQSLYIPLRERTISLSACMGRQLRSTPSKLSRQSAAQT